MRHAIAILINEWLHFKRQKAKLFATLCFVVACVYAISNGFNLQQRQLDTIADITAEQQKKVEDVTAWFDQERAGPEDRDWINARDPYWAIRSTPTTVIKRPSALLPLGIGQVEQYGYYKQLSLWSTTYDTDMVEELANPERLVNGSIDFSFVVLFLLPLLLIVLTYNVGGLERDQRFVRLVAIQTGSVTKWLFARFSFYVLMVLLTVLSCAAGVAWLNAEQGLNPVDLAVLSALMTAYVIGFSACCWGIVSTSSSSSSAAFKMISVWLLLCVIIPGAVHQYANLKYPASYMTDFLDVNRKETYATFELPPETIKARLLQQYPTLNATKRGAQSDENNSYIRQTVGAVINDMNRRAIAQLETQQEEKNRLIARSYWFNPVTLVLNRWNATTSTDYYAYKAYRERVQSAIDRRMELLVFEVWNQREVDRLGFKQYVEQLNPNP